MKKFAGLLTAGLVAATLTACNDKEAKSDATKAQAPANDTVYLYTWTEYVPDGLLDDFTKETGIKVIVASLESNETMYAKMKTQGDAGGYGAVLRSGNLERMVLGLHHHQKEGDVSPSGHSAGDSHAE